MVNKHEAHNQTHAVKLKWESFVYSVDPNQIPIINIHMWAASVCMCKSLRY